MATVVGTPSSKANGVNYNIFDILHDSDDDASTSQNSSTVASITTHKEQAILGEVNVNTVQGVTRPSPEQLAQRLEGFHIRTPRKASIEELPVLNKTRGLKRRPRIEASTYFPIEDKRKEEVLLEDFEPILEDPTVIAVQVEETPSENILAQRLNNEEELFPDWMQVARHQAGLYEYVLTVPIRATPASDSTVNELKPQVADNIRAKEETTTALFGCSLVRADGSSEIKRKKSDHSLTSYTLIVTPIEGDEEALIELLAEPVTQVADKMADTAVVEIPGFSPPMPQGAWSRRTSDLDKVSDSKDDDIIEQIIAMPPPPPSNSGSRIEDSVEALDELEEQLEAINEVTQLERVLSPEATKPSANKTHTPASERQPKMSTATTTTKTTTPGSVRAKQAPQRSQSVRNSINVAPTKGCESTATRSAGSSKRLSVLPPAQPPSVPRPASLAPPKPLAKTAKQPTVSTFELPGDAVARRLKEKREARLSMQIAPGSSSYNTLPARLSTSPMKRAALKPPTRPNFELPGEAISRRKKEEREARLKAEAEEERKRREFKARPVKESVVHGGTYPRQTAASRARIGLKTAGLDPAVGASAVQQTPTPASVSSSSKRFSTIGPGTLSKIAASRPSLGVSTLTAPTASSRGRAAAVAASPTATRGTSSSTTGTGGSAKGGSSISAEELQVQKLRGREIYAREQSFVSEREKERREREEAAKLARQEAAERSRALSREWKEKERAKRLGQEKGSVRNSFAA